jgi:hypothetical protein
VANETYTAFLKDPDQPARRAELLAFIGPNPAPFMKTYDQQVATANREPGSKIKFAFGSGFLWAPLFLGPVWFFYRKMWGWGLGITGLIVVLGLLPIHGNGVGIGLGAGCAVGGALLYVSQAIRQIEALRAACGGGPVDLRELAARGGVSKAAGWTAGAAYLVLVLVFFVVASHN